jgi:hypothetical protein
MWKAAILIGLVSGLLILILLKPGGGQARDAGLIAMIACTGVYVTWLLPLEGE